MINSHQVVTMVVMGAGLILLGLVPGLLQTCADGIAEVTQLLSVRLGIRSPERAEFKEPHWFALAGVAVIALTFLAYLSH